MVIHERTEDGILFLRPGTDRLVASTAGELKSFVHDRVSRGCRVLVLNLVDVEFMDSSGLGVLISALRALDGRGELVLCGVREAVMGLLRLAGMDRIFAIFETEEQAHASRASRVL